MTDNFFLEKKSHYLYILDQNVAKVHMPCPTKKSTVIKKQNYFETHLIISSEPNTRSLIIFVITEIDNICHTSIVYRDDKLFEREGTYQILKHERWKKTYVMLMSYVLVLRILSSSGSWATRYVDWNPAWTMMSKDSQYLWISSQLNLLH